MPKPPLPALVLGLALAVAGGPALASEAGSIAVWVDPGWRRTTARWSVTFEESGLSRRTLDFAYRALDEKGARAIAQQAFPYDSAFDDLTVGDLETVKADGRVIPIDGRAVKDQPLSTDTASPYFDQQRWKVVAFMDVAAGDTIRGHLTYTAKSARLPGAYMETWNQPLDSPPETVEITVDGPASMPLQVAAVGVTEAVERHGDRIIRHVALRQDAGQPLRDAADGSDTARRYEVSTFRDWRAFAAVLAARNAPKAVPDDAVRRLSGTIVEGAATVREKVERIYDWVARNIRYVGIGLGDGGLTSQPAGSVLASRYADCKGHVTVFKALLAAQGIGADLVAIDTEPRYVRSGVAGLMFDHVLAYVPALDLYLDPTAAMAEFGSLPPGLNGKPVLDIDQGTLATTPLLRPADDIVAKDTRVTLQPDGTWQGVSTLSGGGFGSAVTRASATDLESVDAGAIAARAMTRAGLPGTGAYTFPNPRDLSERFAIEAPFTVAARIDLTRPATLRLVAPADPRPGAWAIVRGGPTDHAFPCSSVVTRDTASLDLPPGSTLFEIPSDLRQEQVVEGDTVYGHVTGHLSIAGRFSLTGRTVRKEVITTLAFDAAVCPAAFSDAVKAVLAEAETYATASVGITPKAVAFLIDSSPEARAARASLTAGDYPDALARWSALAARGNPDAENNLGWIYKKGLGVAQDFAESFRWYLRSAAQGNALGQSYVAYYYRCGCGVVGSDRQAALWYGRSARQGFAYAETQLADMTMHGNGVDEDHAAAVSLYEQAAAQGDVDAERALGRLYEGGYGLAADHPTAARWFRAAAEADDGEAQEALGRLYADGHGVPRDDAAAAVWLRKAADKGRAEAQYQLGWLYELGLGVPRDPARARAWYRQALLQDHAGARARFMALDQSARESQAPGSPPAGPP